MLSGLILENFKAFGKRQTIPMAPITLLFGANSAGKSSILQSLLLLQQTMQHRGLANYLEFKGRLTDLGSFREMVFDRDLTRLVEIAPLVNTADYSARSRLGLGFCYRFDDQRK